jgi:hypothetical protein
VANEKKKPKAVYQEMGRIVLKSGERVDAGVVRAPDLEWASRLEEFLAHKGELLNWQNSALLRNDVGIETYFYLLHRDGKTLANIMTAELCGVGFLGHVFTRQEDRRKGACSALMGIQMTHFRARGGKALFLSTGYDSPAYHIYASYGFRGVEPKSGHMAYYIGSKEGFDAEYFGADRAEVRPPAWPHWPASAALFLGDFPGVVRCLPMSIIGRGTTEGSFPRLLRSQEARQAKGELPRAQVLVNERTTAVLGLALWDWHPLWPGVCLVDVYCHPNFWDRADELLSSLSTPAGSRWLAYADASFDVKCRALLRGSFKRTATLASRALRDKATGSFEDVAVFERC